MFITCNLYLIKLVKVMILAINVKCIFFFVYVIRDIRVWWMVGIT